MPTPTTPQPEPLRVLVVDDSALYRRLLSDAVATIPHASVVGTAADGLGALEKLEQVPVDFVVLDIEMPNLDGLQTLNVIRRRWPKTGVVIVSGLDDRAAELTVEALSRGALDFVPKGGGRTTAESEQQLVLHLTRAVASHRAKRPADPLEPASPPKRVPPYAPSLDRAAPAAGNASGAAPRCPAGRTPSAIEAIAIATSTGGPRVLCEAIPALPPSLPVPVFIVQHMPAVFTAALARNLDAQSAITVCEARDGQPVTAGTVYLAPGGRHMVTRAAAAPGGAIQIGILPAAEEDIYHPAADILLRSLATTYGGRVLVAVMTGMGEDGASGVRALKQRGAYCLAQNEETCVVYGMPRAVVEAGLSDEFVTPSELGPRIVALVELGRAQA